MPAAVSLSRWILIMAPGNGRKPVPGIERTRGEAPAQRGDRKSGSSIPRSAGLRPPPIAGGYDALLHGHQRFYCLGSIATDELVLMISASTRETWTRALAR